MTIYLLDGNILTDLETPDTPAYHAILQRLEDIPKEDEVCFSILSAYEYLYGIEKAPLDITEALRMVWETFLDLFDVLPLTLGGAERFGKLKAAYEQHTGIKRKEAQRHTVDLMLAATALELGAVLVSHDNIFNTIKVIEPGLRLEDWQQPLR